MPRGGGRGSGGGGGGRGRGSGGGGRGSGGRGQKSGHKGQRRHFTSPEELEAMKEREERERQWRKDRGDESSEEGDDSDKSGSEGGSSDSEEEKKPEKKEPIAAGDIENPNRLVVKAKKVTDIDLSVEAKPELSRREREELERQKARQNYMKLHAEGKTDEARADLARLAIIKKQREEAAKKREDEKNAKEAARVAKTESTNKALGKGRKT